MPLAQTRIRSGWPPVSSLTERIAEPGESIVDRVAHVAVVDVHPVRGGDELDDLAGVERPVHLGQRAAARDAVLDDGVGHLAEGVAHGVHALDVAVRGAGRFGGLTARPIGAFGVDQAATGEPGEGEISVGSFSTGKPSSVSRVFRKSKVVSTLTSWAWPGRASWVERAVTICNHITPIDRLRARAYDAVTN